MSAHNTMVVTDCCGQLLPKESTLVGDVHFPDLCPACQLFDGREHDRHVTCDWSKGIDCPGPGWTYENRRILPGADR
jgi:hypothetical protein